MTLPVNVYDPVSEDPRTVPFLVLVNKDSFDPKIYEAELDRLFKLQPNGVAERWYPNDDEHTGPAEYTPGQYRSLEDWRALFVGPKINVEIHHHRGDIFDAPPNSLLVHACNSQGAWGAGIAKEFRVRYPCAYQVYRNWCLKEHDPHTDPVDAGTCLLIPPSESDSKKPKHFICCLFTSVKYGKGKDTEDSIRQNTRPAFIQCLHEVREVEFGSRGEVKIPEIRMPKINSGNFGVPWEDTERLLRTIVSPRGFKQEVHVWSLPEIE